MLPACGGSFTSDMLLVSLRGLEQKLTLPVEEEESERASTEPNQSNRQTLTLRRHSGHYVSAYGHFFIMTNI